MKKKEESEKRERKKEVVCAAVATVTRQISTLFFGSAKVFKILGCATSSYVGSVLKKLATVNKGLYIIRY
jgi:uncharacterized protein YsxB (DUF464 family)